jgi:hypothetical protein
MKKFLLASAISLSILTSVVPANAAKQVAIAKVTDVYYEDVCKSYSLFCQNGESGWALDIFGTKYKNDYVIKLLKIILNNKKVKITYEDKDTRSIWDDEIIKWELQ